MAEREFKAPFYLIVREGQNLVLRMTRGNVAVVFNYGKSPRIIPVDDGNYEMDFEPLPGAKLPMGVQILPKKMADLACKLPASQVDQILNVALLGTTKTGAAS